jgi:hypothetical protein
VTETVADNLHEAIASLTELRAAGLRGARLLRFVVHRSQSPYFLDGCGEIERTCPDALFSQQCSGVALDLLLLEISFHLPRQDRGSGQLLAPLFLCLPCQADNNFGRQSPCVPQQCREFDRLPFDDVRYFGGYPPGPC